MKRDAQNVTLPEVIEERWGQYYYWGTGILVSMTVFTLSLCSCWYYERRRRIQNKFHDDPLLSEDIMMEERVFRKFKTAFRHKQDNGVYLDERSLSNNK